VVRPFSRPASRSLSAKNANRFEFGTSVFCVNTGMPASTYLLMMST
jgi:hypothetical protein